MPELCLASVGAAALLAFSVDQELGRLYGRETTSRKLVKAISAGAMYVWAQMRR